MGSLTPLGLPYPVGTDLVKDGDDAIKAMADKLDGWFTVKTWAASLTSGGTAPNLGNGTFVLGYRHVGRWCDFHLQLTLGSTTTFGSGTLFVGPIPVPIKVGLEPAFDVQYFDVSLGGVFAGRAYFDMSSARLGLLAAPASAGTYDRAVSSTVPFAWAVGDRLSVVGSYETAAGG